MKVDLNEIKELLSKATPGPWFVIRTEVFVENGPVCKLWGDGPKGQFQFENYENNGPLIANTTEWLASLVEEVERLDKECDMQSDCSYRYHTQVEELQKTQSQILKRVADISPSLAKSIIKEFALEGESNDHR